MKLEYKKAKTEDALLLIDIYNSAFYNDYVKYGNVLPMGKLKR